MVAEKVAKNPQLFKFHLVAHRIRTFDPSLKVTYLPIFLGKALNSDIQKGFNAQDIYWTINRPFVQRPQ